MSGALVDSRFRVLRDFAPAAEGIAVAQDLTSGRTCWVIRIALTASAPQLVEALERHRRFGLSVPGLARPLAAGFDRGQGYVAFTAPASGSVADVGVADWTLQRVAALASRIAAALAPLHDQGIAYGLLLPELINEGPEAEVLFGFGVTELANRFAAPGEASQLVPPNLRAPELRSSLQRPTPASDLFALGSLLRGLLPAAIPPEIEAHLTRATAENAQARPHEVSTFAAHLTRLVESVSVQANQRALEVAPPLASALLDPPALENGPEPVPVPVLEPLPDAASVSAPSLPLIAPPSPPLTRNFQPFVPNAIAPPRSPLLAILLVLSGLVLMLGGVAFAVVYAVRHAPAAPAKAAAAPPPAPAPTTTAAPPPAVEPAPPSEPEITPNPRSARHAPIVAPGAGPSSFPEEARAALPVLGSEPIWGTRNAPLTWVFFGDLDCPHTRKAWRSLEGVKATFGDDLRIVFRHRPLREHPEALDAARVLAGVARVHGATAFFDVLHRALQGDASLTPERLTTVLQEAGYGGSKLSDLSAAGDAQVRADLQLAGQFSVRSTPYSFLNGQAVDGERTSFEVEQLLREEQRTAVWITASGVPSAALYATRTSSNLIGVGNAGESRSCAPIGRSPTRGPADALVTLVEFSDFECQYCKRAEPTLKALLARYPKTLRLVWKDYPLPQHKGAQLLANFAADAYRRGSVSGFWAVHDGIFAQAEALDDGTLGALAGKAGLDGALLLISAHAGVHDAAIREDMKLGQRLSVTGTPTFFANGRRIEGALPLEQFDALIQEELRTAQRIVTHGTAARDVYGLLCD
ncbi:MAG TPA: thioredoxin domain-containing protein [Polyangiaceae bacterium]|nr:thioredoxin domain-containing protein [Polyangiaceae bacterium]